MKFISRHIIKLTCIFICGCLEPYNPEIPDSQNEFLIVDGLITDKSGPYTVKVLKSSSFTEDSEYVTGLQVSIEEQGGTTEMLEETSPGIYQTHSLQGVIGNSYRLNISHQGQQYQSTWETIYASPAIDSIYYEYEVRGTTDKDNDQEGLQFFVDNHGPENGVKYFRYEWVETWEFGVYWPSTEDYLGNDMSARTTDPRYQCWKDQNSTGINIGTTDGLTQNVLSGHPLVYAPKDEERFTQTYSLLVRQYALQETEYTFWKKLKEANQDQGSFFDKQPANVLGNMSSVANSGDVALGYFSASGSQEVRVWVDRTDVPPSLGRVPTCTPLDSLLKADFAMLPGTYEISLNQRLASGEFFYGFIFSEVSIAPVGALLATPKCADCTAKGGDLNKPEFWDE